MDFDLSRLRNLFHPNPNILISDDPRNGGISGNLPRTDPNNSLGFPAPKNPFGGIFKTNPMQVVQDDTDPYDPLARMKELYNPEHAYSDEYLKALHEMPMREKPTIMRRIGGVLAGISGGPEAASKYLDDPYNERMVDWNARIKAIEPGMQYERYSNANDRMLANETIGREIQDRRADIANKESDRKAKADEAKRTNDAENTEIRRSRAAAYIYKQSHPNHQFQEDKQGNLIALDPVTGKAEYVLDPDGLPIQSSKLPDADRINLMNSGRIQAIQEQSTANQKLETQRQTGRIATTRERGEQARQTKTGTGTEPTVTEQTIKVKDAQGNITGEKTTTTKKGPEAKITRHRVQYQGKDGKMHVALVPKEKLQEALKNGGKDLGEVK